MPADPERNPTREGRQRVFYISRREFLTLIGFDDPDRGRKVIRVVGGLPPDAYVSSVNYDCSRACFCITVDSREFLPIADGALISEIPVCIEEIDPTDDRPVNFKEWT